MGNLTERDLAELNELLSDADGHRLLTRWELDFVKDFKGRVEEHGLRTNVSDKQYGILQRVEKKVYAT